ncbi:MAG: hypothetical protein LEGION0398_MBIBDBAK_00003 [Legionellaceae bacterium]
MQRPNPSSNLGMHHIALFVQNFESCLFFYSELLDMSIEWQPDEDNVYLSSGSENLALHRIPQHITFAPNQVLDHIGFILRTPEDVDIWYNYLVANQVTIKAEPRIHRDGAKSFYCLDPDGNTVQMLYHPPLSQGK